MAEEKTEEPSEETPTGPSDESRALLKGLVKEALNEFRDENKPSPQRTKRTPNFIDQIFGM